MRYLGIDYGSKKVGLALSDEGGTMGFPYRIIPNTPELLDALCSLAAAEKVGAIVIGESRTLAGDANPIAADARRMGDALAARTGLPVAYESEVFTTAEARRQYAPESKSRKPVAQPAVDASAAALILTSFLTKQKSAQAPA